jgi:hypothetical protein
VFGNDSQAEIVDSGIIQVTEGARAMEEEKKKNGNDGEEDDEEEEVSSYNIDIELYRAILSDGDSITFNSTSLYQKIDIQ